MTAAIALERGRRAEARGRYPEAIKEYESVIRAFPGSTTAQGRLGIALYHVHDTKAAIELFSKLPDRGLPRDLVAEINGIIDDMRHQRP